MARKFLVSLDLNKNELLNARLQNLSSDPSSPVAGQIYYNTTDNVTKFYDGTQWIAGGSTKFGLEANRPAASKGGTLYAATDTNTLFLDNGTSWIQISVNPQDLADAINDHNNATSGVHGVTGDVVGTTDVQSLSNKTVLGPLYIQSGGGAGGNNNTITANNNTGNLEISSGYGINISTSNGDIILNPDGFAYISSADSNNRIATIGDLNSDAVIQSVSGTTNQIDVSNTSGNVTVSLPSEVHIKRASDGASSIVLDADNAKITLNDPNAEVKVLDIYNIDSNAQITSEYSLNLNSGNGDISLNPDGQVVINGNLDVDGNVYTSHVYGPQSGDKSLTLSDGNNASQIHINETTKNIELLPDATAKAYYGSSATAGNEIARISDIEALSSGLNWKEAVNLLYDDSTPALSGVTGTLVIDGHAALTSADNNYRILIINALGDNGIYYYQDDGSTWTLTRTADADSDAELKGAAVFVMEGTNYGSTSWVQSNHYTSGLVGQDWHQFSGQGTYIGSNSIVIDGREIGVVVDNTRGLAIDGDGVYTKIGNGIEFDGSGNVAINAGTGFDISSGALEFATSYGVRKFATSIGGEGLTYADVTHNFGTKDVNVTVFENSSDNEVFVDVKHYDNKVVISCAEVITTAQYRVVVIG